MYKGAADFLAYMDRSNKFVDRILAGGNRLDTDVVDRETEADALVSARAVIAKAAVEAAERWRAAKDRRAEMRRESFGRSRAQVDPESAKRIDAAERQHNRARAELEWCEFYRDAIDARLLAVGTPNGLTPAQATAVLAAIRTLDERVGVLTKRLEHLESII